jgi:hypothetical protein
MALPHAQSAWRGAGDPSGSGRTGNREKNAAWERAGSRVCFYPAINFLQ